MHEVGWRVKSKIDFTTNYCGAYWSAGKFQSSVEDDSVKPVSPLDEQCRLHDRAYARNEDRVQADQQFFHGTRDLGLRGKLYGSAVLYGNRLIRGVMGGFGSVPRSWQTYNPPQNKNINSGGKALRGAQVPFGDFAAGATRKVEPGQTGVVYDPEPDQPTPVPTVFNGGSGGSQPISQGGHEGMVGPVGLPSGFRYPGQRKKFRKKKKKKIRYD